MNYKQIHETLKEQGLSWVGTAEAIGCSHQHVMGVCARRVESLRVAKSVALLLDKEVSEVFPDVPRYQEDKKADRQSKITEAKARLAAAGLAEAV